MSILLYDVIFRWLFTLSHTNLFRFKIRDIDTSTTLFEIAKPVGYNEDSEDDDQREAVDPSAGRFVRYQFTSQVSNNSG